MSKDVRHLPWLFYNATILHEMSPIVSPKRDGDKGKMEGTQFERRNASWEKPRGVFTDRRGISGIIYG